MPKVAMLNTKLLKYKLFDNKKVYIIVYTFYFLLNYFFEFF